MVRFPELFQTRGRIQDVANIRDLLLEIADLSRDNGAPMKGGAERRYEPELVPVSLRVLGQLRLDQEKKRMQFARCNPVSNLHETTTSSPTYS